MSYRLQSKLSYIYPNDYTRLTHLEKQGSCFYPEKLSLQKDPAQTNNINYDPRWSQTFEVKYVDYKENRSDSIDLTCEEKANLLLSSSEALPVVQAFMDIFNEKHPGYELHLLFFSSKPAKLLCRNIFESNLNIHFICNVYC